MKALSVKNPHAHRIATGEKTLEIRSWPTRHRGPVLICVSGRPDRQAMAAASASRLAGDGRHLPAGVMLCIVDVVGCRPMTAEDAKAACTEFIPGHFAWELANVRAVKPVPIKGRLMLFTVPDEMIQLAGEIAGNDIAGGDDHGGSIQARESRKGLFRGDSCGKGLRDSDRLAAFQAGDRSGVERSGGESSDDRAPLGDQRIDAQRVLRDGIAAALHAEPGEIGEDVFADAAGGAGCGVAAFDGGGAGDSMAARRIDGAFEGAGAICGLGGFFGWFAFGSVSGRIGCAIGRAVAHSIGFGACADRPAAGDYGGGRSDAAGGADRAIDADGGSSTASGGDLPGGIAATGIAERSAGEQSAEVNMPAENDTPNHEPTELNPGQTMVLPDGCGRRAKFYVRFRRSDGRIIEREFGTAGAAEYFIAAMKLESWVVHIDPVISTDPAELERAFAAPAAQTGD